jgi:septal ring factor EnvC (AmiA/AmiB activator)
MGTKTDKLVEQLADTHKRLRDSSSRSGMSAQDRALLERQIAKLEGSVADLTAQLGEQGVAYIKKDSMFTMAARQAMSQLVTQQGTTFNSAYQDVVVAWQCMALQMGHTVAGLIARRRRRSELERSCPQTVRRSWPLPMPSL